MSEIGDTWEAIRAARAAKRARNRVRGPAELEAAGLRYESKNEGAHLVVEGRWDYWPGTGLWIDRQTRERRRGVRELVRRVRVAKEAG